MFYSRLSFPYWLTSDNTISLPPTLTGSTTVNFTVDHSFDIEAGKLMSAGFNTLNGSPQSVPCHIQLQEGRSGRTITDGFVHNLALFGTSNFPIILFEPLLIKRGTTMKATINNDVTGFSNQGIDLVFHGRALPYRLPGMRALESVTGGINKTMSNMPTTVSQKDVSYRLPVEPSPRVGRIV
jgi:hypothetical protein